MKRRLRKSNLGKNRPEEYVRRSTDEGKIVRLDKKPRNDIVADDGDDDDDQFNFKRLPVTNRPNDTWALKETISQDADLTKMPTLREDEPKVDKSEWFRNTKYAFTTIKLSQDAPDMNVLLPPLSADEDDEDEVEEKRPWWFFNQVDWKPFPIN